MCGFYEQLTRGQRNSRVILNYLMALNYPSLTKRVSLICDEAHGLEHALVTSKTVTLKHGVWKRYGGLFKHNAPEERVTAWAKDMMEQLDPEQNGYRFLSNALRKTGGYRSDWVQDWDEHGVTLSPMWGLEYGENLWGPPGEGAETVVLMSATLLAPEYVAEKLALQPGSYDYLDLPSTFPVENRPIYYAPVLSMNFQASRDHIALNKMVEYIDTLIEQYVRKQLPWGLIHTVSNRLQNDILTRSRWRAIMVVSDVEHAQRVRKDQPSVLVAANRLEGWDGVGNLCRFIIMPKVPFPPWYDARVKARREKDARDYDYDTIVSVVQGVGRGVRSDTDTCDTWIIDGSWKRLYDTRRAWLPDAFTDAYQPVRM